MKKLWQAFIFGMIGVGMLATALESDGWLSESRAALAAGAAVAMALSGLVVVEWMARVLLPLWDMHEHNKAERLAMTPDSELVRRMAELQPYQSEALLALQTRLTATPGVAGAVVEYALDEETRVPVEFAQAWMEASQGETLQPIRAYAEGTKGREWAQALTGFFVRRGLARPASGNSPARWIYGAETAAGWLALAWPGAAEEVQ